MTSTNALRETPYPKSAGNWIGTYTGRKFWPLNPRVEDVDIRDIAHALSMQCRYVGHVKHHYSVAQHSLEVSLRVSPENALVGLLHDASEAYMSDLAKPVKHSGALDNFRDIEDRITRVVFEAFGLDPEIPEEVKKQDLEELVTEADQLFMRPPPEKWHLKIGTPREEPLLKLTPEEAESLFLGRFYELVGEND